MCPNLCQTCCAHMQLEIPGRFLVDIVSSISCSSWVSGRWWLDIAHTCTSSWTPVIGWRHLLTYSPIDVIGMSPWHWERDYRLDCRLGTGNAIIGWIGVRSLVPCCSWNHTIGSRWTATVQWCLRGGGCWPFFLNTDCDVLPT